MRLYDYTVAYCKQHYPEEIAKNKQYADLILEDKFYLRNTWSENVQTRPAHYENGWQWLKTLSGDPEFVWELNRHFIFVYLGRQYCVCEDEKYLQKYKTLILHWIDNVKLQDDPFHKKAWRPLDVGIRIKNWLIAFDYMKDALQQDAEFMQKFNGSLQEHLQYLTQFYTEKNILLNWGVLQNHGLFCLCCFLGHTDLTCDPMKEAFERLCGELEAQFMSDGLHWEQSINYHIEMVNCFVDILVFAQKYAVQLPSFLVKKVHELAVVCLAVVKPDGNVPMTGDSDDFNLQSDFAKYSVIFADGRFKYMASNLLSYECCWLLGKKGIKDYENLKAIEPDFTNAFLADSGNHYLRTGWQKDANYLHFINGYTGGGHAHSDKLHIDFSAKGKDFLVDAGRYSYAFYDLKRRYIKSSKAHNTVRMGHRDFIKYDITNWGFLRKAPSFKLPYREQDEFVLLQGAHAGYLRCLGGGMVTRTILWIKPDIYVISDICLIKGFHSIQRHFNFSPDCMLTRHAKTIEIVNDSKKIVMHFPSKSVLTLKKGLFSRYYGQLKKNQKIVEHSFSIGLKNHITILDASAKATVTKNAVYSKGKVLRDKKAESVRIQIADDIYDVLLCHQELMKYVYIQPDIGGAGKLLVFKNGKKVFTQW